MDMLVTPEWLAAEAGAPDLRILDATYHALEPDRDARAEFEAGHIPGALHLDLAGLRDAADPLPSMAPAAEQFAARLAALGIKAGDRVVFYDQAPHHTSARAWWLFRLFGFERVAILDGGLAGWRRARQPVATGPAAEPGDGAAVAARRAALVRDKADVLAIVDAGGATQLVDARSAARFSGSEGDPRPGVAGGHIPGAINLPYGRLIDADGVWQPPEAIARAFAQAGVDVGQPIVTTCGSGITAAILLFGLALIGRADAALYDGSWSEWGADPALPKESVA